MSRNRQFHLGTSETLQQGLKQVHLIDTPDATLCDVPAYIRAKWDVTTTSYAVWVTSFSYYNER